MDVGYTLALGEIIDISCGFLHPHRALSQRYSWASCCSWFGVV